MAARPQINSDKIAEIVALYKDGKPLKDISNSAGVKLRTVQRWVKRFRDGGGVSLPGHKEHPGKAKKINQRTLNVIRRQLEVNPRLTAKEIQQGNPNLLASVSLRTVQHYIHDDLQYLSHRPLPKPELTERQRRNRLIFAKKYKEWDVVKWRSVLWSDEAMFCVTGNPSGRVYRRRGSDPIDPKYTRGVVKHPDKVMVWGCFSYHSTGNLVFFPKNVTVNKNNYLELLCDHLPDSFDKCGTDFFMQDGAPCHTAKDVTQWLTDCDIPFFSDWPGNSPDLNPIENLWAILKRKLRQADTSSVTRLKAAIRKEWEEINPDILKNLASSLPTRLNECIKRKGMPTHY